MNEGLAGREFPRLKVVVQFGVGGRIALLQGRGRRSDARVNFGNKRPPLQNRAR
jgi:hypothetical protein